MLILFQVKGVSDKILDNALQVNPYTPFVYGFVVLLLAGICSVLAWVVYQLYLANERKDERILKEMKGMITQSALEVERFNRLLELVGEENYNRRFKVEIMELRAIISDELTKILNS